MGFLEPKQVDQMVTISAENDACSFLLLQGCAEGIACYAAGELEKRNKDRNCLCKDLIDPEYLKEKGLAPEEPLICWPFCERNERWRAEDQEAQSK